MRQKGEKSRLVGVRRLGCWVGGNLNVNENDTSAKMQPWIIP